MDLGLRGKAAIVGGSSKGIGRAIAMALAGEGCDVTICARGEKALVAAAEEIRDAAGVRVHSVVCDMARYDDIKRVVRETVEALGRLDIVVNNAGGPPTGSFDELNEEAWQRALEQNLLSAVRMVREALPHLRQAGGGRIINVTSIAVKQPIDRLMLSNSARLGVVGMAKTLSRELAPYGITVNNVCPGNIATERLVSLMEERAQREGRSMEAVVEEEESRVPAGLLGEPEDVANLAVFLASDKARYITGTTIQVDGGSTQAVF
ncbi:MAG: SDR family oxidoreductase [Chloroflexi bacterium]|nr:SDR family oxidoreductase [Chloroflexota bacterium]